MYSQTAAGRFVRRSVIAKTGSIMLKRIRISHRLYALVFVAVAGMAAITVTLLNASAEQLRRERLASVEVMTEHAISQAAAQQERAEEPFRMLATTLRA